MWEVLVVLVRLPVTIILFVLATVIGAPFVLIIGSGIGIISFLGIPFGVVLHLFTNDKKEFKEIFANLGKPFIETPEVIGEMYKSVFKWGFPFNSNRAEPK